MSSDPAPVNHTFKIQKLANTEPSKLRKYVKVQLYIKKRSDVSYEYFKDHWAHAHADILVSLKGFRESGILHYSQFTVDPKMQQIFKDAGLPVMEWDGCAEMWFTSIEDFFTIAKDEGFVKALEDMKNFVSVDDGEPLMAGYETMIFGETVPGYGEMGLSLEDLNFLS